jgi:hypothetical protein
MGEVRYVLVGGELRAAACAARHARLSPRIRLMWGICR